MFSLSERVLVVAPHTDDGEIAAGATISRLLRQGCRVFYLALSSYKTPLPAGLPRDTLVNEVKAATQTLGISPDDLIIRDFETRRFSYQRQDILDELIRLRPEIRPDLVLIPSADDLHQDHQTAAIEAIRAFKNISILSYEVPWNNIEFRNSMFVKVEEEDVAKKLAALEKYESQRHRAYLSPEFIRSQLIFRGTQINTRYAEVFDAVRIVV
ncbi:PIG-L deacetylase family protein [Lacibacterium aquatile]|uniref:PIG-L deacetylase family protein n=1 Tax=Lacibacterium aquatile TaxID=1168082 RepID=A0ABW5DVS6_9PROT